MQEKIPIFHLVLKNKSRAVIILVKFERRIRKVKLWEKLFFKPCIHWEITYNLN